MTPAPESQFRCGPIRLITLLVGRTQALGTEGAVDVLDRPWTSGIFKSPKQGPVWLGREGLAGDEQADLKHHGGPEKAIFACASEHLPAWREVLGHEEVGPGAFGENFLLEGATEDSVCIGDTFRCGEALLQVSQPRQPCWKPSRRWRRKELSLLIQRTGMTGWYFRVLREGHVREGDLLELLERPCPDWTVALANRAMHHRPVERELAARLSTVSFLSPGWRTTLEALAKGQERDTAPRLLGPNQD
ncbi:MOSC domain-containing protein [Archangium violaceum]|uniref:MOSC domain-containing protein n=1 Tax=Archangium violaceum TaxID=83451 RepID=UPI002B2F8FA7|nr:MOSC domain-containing protein [Archangium violaceum]